MEDIKKNISENLVLLRKSNKLTQQELAKKFNYSDKAISRWELGDSLPDIGILIKLCEFYNVSFEWLIKEHTEVPKTKKNRSNKTLAIKISIILLLAVCIFALATLYYVYNLLFFEKNTWIIFVWAVPVSCILISFLCIRWWNRIVTTIFYSLTLWTLIASLFLQFYNQIKTWPLFLIGIPIQLILVLLAIIKKERL